MTRSRTARTALAQLEDGPQGGLVWAAGGLERVQAVLAAELATASAAQAVDELLRLMAVLRKKRASPETADALGAVLRQTPGARALVRRKAPVGGIDQTRGFAQREGRDAAVRAPHAEATAPEGALLVRTLLDPGGHDRARALTANRRKDPSHGRR